MPFRFTRSKSTLALGIWLIFLGVSLLIPNLIIHEKAIQGLIIITAGVLVLLGL